MTMKIIDPHSETGWVTAIIEGRWVQAKVYDEPSTYGVNNGRVSKIAIGKTDTRDSSKSFFEQMCFNYDRGLDFDEAPSGLVNKIIAELETLPKIFPDVTPVQEEVKAQTAQTIKKTRYNL